MRAGGITLGDPFLRGRKKFLKEEIFNLKRDLANFEDELLEIDETLNARAERRKENKENEQKKI